MNAYRLIEDGSADNSIPDPGETVRMPVTLFNGGGGTALGVNGLLQFVNPAQGTLSDPDATWADIVPSQALESDDPYFELTVDAGLQCGEILAFELDILSANADTWTKTFEIPMGDPQRDFRNSTDYVIPPETASPVISEIVIDQDHPIAELDVTVNVQHGMESELIVELESPSGTSVRLHDQNDLGGSGIHFRYDLELSPAGPGTMGDFTGESTLGSWRLSVEDVGAASSGDGWIRDWTLHMRVNSGFDCLPGACDAPVLSEPVTALLVDKSINGEDLDLVLDWGDLVSAAGYHVLQSETAAFDNPIESGRTEGEATLTIPNGAYTTPSLTYFQVRGVNICDVEGP
jgi:subtilisin-like proprotein convertase family protein